MALKIVTSSPTTVTTAGTAVEISANITAIRSIVLQADAANTGIVYVGDSSVTSSNGIQLKAGDSVSITPDNKDNELVISDLYVNADTNGSIVRVSYETNRN